MVVASVEMAMFSVDQYCMLGEGDIKGNKVFVGIVDCSEIYRRREDFQMLLLFVDNLLAKIVVKLMGA